MMQRELTGKEVKAQSMFAVRIVRNSELHGC